ncbi:MAG: response regulator [Chloroflexota bacterium]
MILEPYRVIIATAYPPVSAVLRRLITATHRTANVEIVTSGQAALQAYRRGGADVIFADYNLPELSGLSLVRTLRQEDLDVPIVVLSVDPYCEEQSLDAGASHFLVKPFAITAVEALLSELLPVRRARAYGERA